MFVDFVKDDDPRHDQKSVDAVLFPPIIFVQPDHAENVVEHGTGRSSAHFIMHDRKETEVVVQFSKP